MLEEEEGKGKIVRKSNGGGEEFDWVEEKVVRPEP